MFIYQQEHEHNQKEHEHDQREHEHDQREPEHNQKEHEHKTALVSASIPHEQLRVADFARWDFNMPKALFRNSHVELPSLGISLFFLLWF